MEEHFSFFEDHWCNGAEHTVWRMEINTVTSEVSWLGLFHWNKMMSTHIIRLTGNYAKSISIKVYNIVV